MSTDKLGFNRKRKRDADRDGSDEGPITNTTRPEAPQYLITLRIFGLKTETITLPIYRSTSMGRGDPERGLYPDLDLTEYGAFRYGVSKRHLTLQPETPGLYLIDQGSTNGTWLNRKKIPANEKQPLAQGDLIEIGALPIEVISLIRPSILSE